MWTRWFFLFLFALCVVLCVTPAQAHEQSQPPSMMLSIKNTFYHVCEPLVARKRTQSAPPEVFVGRCIAHALMRERMRERSKARKRNQLTKHAAKHADDDALLEFKRLAILERWERIHTQCLNNDRKHALALVPRKIKDNLRSVLKFRVALEERVYRELEFIMLDRCQAELLKRMGIVRKQGDNIEIWCADSALKLLATKTLLGEARRRVQMCEAKAFQIAIPGDAQIVLSCKGCITLFDLKMIVREQFHIPIANQLLMHLGVEMIEGQLSEDDVFAGSCVQIYNV